MKTVYRLTRLDSNHNHLRTNEVIGEPAFLPRVGYGFQFFAQPLDPTKDVRVIFTSEVNDVLHHGGGRLVEFKTQNSTYRLETLDQLLT